MGTPHDSNYLETLAPHSLMASNLLQVASFELLDYINTKYRVINGGFVTVCALEMRPTLLRGGRTIVCLIPSNSALSTDYIVGTP